MTGFARVEVVSEPLTIIWEIRSVNHRFLDISVRTHEEFRWLESSCRSRVKAILGRGRIECTLKIGFSEGYTKKTILNNQILEELGAIQSEVEKLYPKASQLTILEMLRWPGVLTEECAKQEVVVNVSMEALDDALNSLVEARQNEGQRLMEVLLERCDDISSIINLIRSRADVLEKFQYERLREKLEKLSLDLNEERLEQEIVLLLQRLDISEEIDRIDGHVMEVRNILKTDGPIGRRLDFQVQELNREANTLASKSQDSDITRQSVDLKVLIEQMREQAQNLE